MARHPDPSIVNGKTQHPLSAWFLGPKAENSAILKELVNYILDDYIHWRRNYFPADPIVVDRIRRRNHEFWYDRLTTQIDTILNELKAHYPFYSPRYIAHMVSEQSLPSVIGYFAGMLYNPNNVTAESAPVTVPFEMEAGRMVAEMLGYNPKSSWAHITSGGTVANLEALWVARTVQFAPLVVQDYCRQNGIDYTITLPAGEDVPIADVDARQLLSLKPNEAIFAYKKLAHHLIHTLQREPKSVIESINAFVPTSRFNVAEAGLVNVLNELKLTPKILVSETAHYSIKKVANLLGYGETNVEKIPVESNFRLNADELKNRLENLGEDEYVAAVIGILGTTEEGAIDPIHEIKFIRDTYHKSHNRSFWLHVDAAWGGYIKSLLNHPDLKDPEIEGNLDDVYKSYVEKLVVEEEMDIVLGDRTLARGLKISWADPWVYKALLTLGAADSSTIDPHKLGYIPYPAGMVCFKNGVVTEHIKQEAQYITDERGGLKSIEKQPEISTIGPFIIEGSKPGAAAAACWLAHKVIPLDTHGHGKIIRTTLLNTRKLCRYMDYHRHMFSQLEEHVTGTESVTDDPFTFKYLATPDSNVVCFIARPMKFKNDVLDEVDCSLQKLNTLNQKLYQKLSVSRAVTAHGQEFFVSRTWFTNSQYAYESIKPLLDRLNVTAEEYNDQGLFVLRSTVMNPWYWTAQVGGMDYLMEFVIALHRAAREVV